jgi:GT2 family glycosyltransferase
MEKIIFGRYVIKNGFSRMRDLMDTEKWKPNTLFNSGEVASYCFSIENKDFKKIGGYEESHLHEGTDEDLVKRLKDSGINMYIDTTTTVFHNESDRLSIWNWMARKERYGEISAFAKRNYKLGNSEIQYTVSKKIIFQFIYGIRKPLVFILRLFPQNFEKLDFVFFKIIDLLLGAHICHGYFKS